jgi:DNA-binding FadR family transcriptional regulator
MMSSGSPVHLTDRVKLDLLRLIEADNLKPGDKLPSADRLCEQFSVSRTVVREAIASLKAEGRVRSLRGSGVYVATPSERQAATSMFMAAPQEIGDILDFMEFRIALEVEAAGLAAERRTETHLLRMAQALTQFRRHMSDSTLASGSDRAFHRAIAEATNNERFVLFVDDMGERLLPRRVLGTTFGDDKSKQVFLDAILLEHQQIYEAITNRRSDDARTAMRRHLEDGRRRYREWSLSYETAR